jgi:hypothetical protein
MTLGVRPLFIAPSFNLMTAPECLTALQLPEHAKGISNGSDIQGEGRRLVQAVECENGDHSGFRGVTTRGS